MLPAWGTVVIALGGAAIGAAAGVIGSYFTLRGARLQIEHEEREAWRSRLVAAAERFLESYERASRVYGDLSEEVVNAREEGRSLGDEEESIAQTERLTRGLLSALTELALVFGPDSDAFQAGSKLAVTIAEALGGVRSLSSRSEAESVWGGFGTARREVVAAVHKEIRPPAA
jgi:hypothetical protein